MSSTDGYCRNVLVLSPGNVMPYKPCPECGHSLLAHIGVDHCPVCELVAQAGRHRVEHAPAEEAPATGDRLHLWSRRFGCLTGVMERPMVFGPGLLIKMDRPDFPLSPLVAESHDESQSINGSWHWPCDGGNRPASCTVNVTVQGSVSAEQDLAEAIRRALRRPPGSAPYAAFKR